MNQAAWEAIVGHYSRVSKTLNKRKPERVFCQNVKAALSRIPEEDRASLLAHWQSEKEAIHPFKGTKHPAPLFIVESDFGAGGMVERATGMMVSKGCCLLFEARVAHTAPGEVVQWLIAHELAHAWIWAKYHKKNLPLPPLTWSSDEQERSLEEYPEAKRHEEWLVDEILTRWGFIQHLIEFWEIAVEDAPKDPEGYYRMIKRSVKENPQAFGIKRRGRGSSG